MRVKCIEIPISDRASILDHLEAILQQGLIKASILQHFQHVTPQGMRYPIKQKQALARTRAQYGNANDRRTMCISSLVIRNKPNPAAKYMG